VSVSKGFQNAERRAAIDMGADRSQSTEPSTEPSESVGPDTIEQPAAPDPHVLIQADVCDPRQRIRMNLSLSSPTLTLVVL